VWSQTNGALRRGVWDPSARKKKIGREALRTEKRGDLHAKGTLREHEFAEKATTGGVSSRRNGPRNRES